MHSPIIVGLSGTNGSGKDTIAHVLRDRYGFYFASATDMLVEELKRRSLPLDRPHKAALSAEWRRSYGMAVIVDKALKAFDPLDYTGIVIASLRHPSEPDRIHEQGGLVIWVDADPKIRYARITTNDRGRIEDRKSYEDFLADEAREMHPIGDAATLNMAAVKKRSDIFITNNGTDIEQFKTSVINHLRPVIDQL